MELLDAARIHRAFHVSMLKHCIGEPAQQVMPLQLTDLIPPSDEGPGPLNLEDKILSQEWSIVMNTTDDIGDTLAATEDKNN